MKDPYLVQSRHLELYYFNVSYLGSEGKEDCYNHGCLRVEKSSHLNSKKMKGMKAANLENEKNAQLPWVFSAFTLREPL